MTMKPLKKNPSQNNFTNYSTIKLFYPEYLSFHENSDLRNVADGGSRSFFTTTHQSNIPITDDMNLSVSPELWVCQRNPRIYIQVCMPDTPKESKIKSKIKTHLFRAALEEVTDTSWNIISFNGSYVRGPAMDWQPVQVVPSLSPVDS